jgi:hypothetical protein
MPSSVKVKYLAVTTVVQKSGFTWAGQVCFILSCLLPPYPSLLSFSVCCRVHATRLSARSSSQTDGRWGRRTSRWCIQHDALHGMFSTALSIALLLNGTDTVELPHGSLSHGWAPHDTLLAPRNYVCFFSLNLDTSFNPYSRVGCCCELRNL